MTINDLNIRPGSQPAGYDKLKRGIFWLFIIGFLALMLWSAADQYQISPLGDQDSYWIDQY